LYSTFNNNASWPKCFTLKQYSNSINTENIKHHTKPNTTKMQDNSKKKNIGRVNHLCAITVGDACFRYSSRTRLGNSGQTLELQFPAEFSSKRDQTHLPVAL